MTSKQLRFIHEYLLDLSASGAARRAGYSKKTAGSQGHDLLKKPEIRTAIATAQVERAKAVGVDQLWVVSRLRREAMGESEDTTPASRVAALALLARYVGGFSDKQEVAHAGAVTVEIKTFGHDAEPPPITLQ